MNQRISNIWCSSSKLWNLQAQPCK